jgi:hypothetical protein
LANDDQEWADGMELHVNINGSRNGIDGTDQHDLDECLGGNAKLK